MIGEKLLGQKPLTLSEMKELLEERKKEKELNYGQDIALKYAKKFSKLTPKETEKIKGELSQIKSLTEEQVVKLIDLLPKKKEVLELILPKGSVTEEEFAKALEIIKKYSKA